MLPLTPIQPEALVGHARQLVLDAADRPGTTLLRRSTSASYYAVFHAVSGAVAAQLAPHSGSEARYMLVRSVAHGRLNDVCRWVTETAAAPNHVRPVVARLRRNADVVHLADIVGELQRARHRADYDNLASIDTEVATAHYTKAAAALDLVERLRATPDGQELFALVALHAPAVR